MTFRKTEELLLKTILKKSGKSDSLIVIYTQGVYSHGFSTTLYNQSFDRCHYNNITSIISIIPITVLTSVFKQMKIVKYSCHILKHLCFMP